MIPAQSLVCLPQLMGSARTSEPCSLSASFYLKQSPQQGRLRQERAPEVMAGPGHPYLPTRVSAPPAHPHFAVPSLSPLWKAPVTLTPQGGQGDWLPAPLRHQAGALRASAGWGRLGARPPTSRVDTSS